MFRPYSPAHPDRLRNHCITCIRARQRSPSYRPPRALTTRLRLYGLSEPDYVALLLSQQNACAICRQPCKRHDFLSIDHDHSTGSVRGLLCNACNTGLGMFQDDPARLHAAASYVSAYVRKTKKGPWSRLRDRKLSLPVTAQADQGP
jgi:hypothetical protein